MLGISYQMHGLVCVDKDMNVLRPSIIWCDSRAVGYGQKAFETLGQEKCLGHLLNSPGNFTASKLAWVKENEPEVYTRIHKIMLPGDYIAMKLTGEVCTTVSGLSEGIFWDFKEGKVSDMLLDYYGIDESLIPEIRPTFSEQGRVSASAAAELGLAEGTPITYRAGDQPNNALSLNVFNPGEIASTAGTSGVVYGVLGDVDYDPESRVNTFAHVNHTSSQTRLGVLLCINGTGILNSWIRRNVADVMSYQEMNELAAQAPVGSGGVSILPFGNGAERMLGNRETGSSIHGLNFNVHGKSHILRAAQEGIVFSFKYGIEVMEQMGMNVAKIHAGHANMFLSPIFRDPRWGRGQETYGEDPYLMTVMGRSVVNGLQGDPDAKHDKLHACLKHFAVHSGPEHNRHIFNVEEVSWRDLNETYLYAFERLVKTTDVKEVMCAYQAFEGKPCCGNDKLLTKILREQWGFKGLVVTDCWAVRDFHTEGCHNMYPDDPAAATAHAVRSGSDLECGTSFPALVEAVQKGLIPESDIDVSLHRLLKARFELGEMDPQRKVKWSKIPADRLACDEHRALALDMARKSMTLLQNNNSVLPLKKDALYAVVGPNAADSVVMWGNYNGDPRKTVTVLEGIQAKVGAENVVYAPGCDIALLADAQLSDEFDAAMFADVDAIIFVGGLSPMLEGEEQPVKAVEEWDMDSDEMKYQLMPVDYVGFNKGDRTSIELPATQRQYIRNLASLGKPLVFVNLSGSAIALAPEAENCDAILQAWYGGEAGGTAVADVLFGDYNPAGRLPLTFYSSDADLPGFEDYDMENRTYRYFKGTPLFPFGHGLSYTTFEYGDAALSDGVLTVPVTNTGSLDGEEVVQVYVKSVADVDGPIKSLRGFKRVHVKAGETVNVEVPFEIDLFNPETGKMEASAGEYLVYYGGSSDESKLKVISYNL